MLPLLSIVLVFAVMLTGIRLKLGLGWSILGGSLLLGLLFGLTPWGWLKTIPAALLTEEALILGLIIITILAFSAVYSASGQSVRFMRTVRGLIRSRSLLLVFFPALIGLLPMPGGAIFSAPMVDNAAQELGTPHKDRALINYWFRHIWELAWPLYPGLILASSLAHIPITDIVRIMWAGPPFFIALGVLFILRPALKNAPCLPPATPVEDVRTGWISGLPLFTAIAGAVLGEWIWSLVFPGRPMEYGVIAALIVATLTSLALASTSWKEVLREAGKDNTLALVAVVAAVFIFKEVLFQGHVVDRLAETLGGEGLITILAIILPYMVGFVSGITMAFVGATFPLLFGLVRAAGQPELIPNLLCLGMFSGVAGIMSSPMHICYLMTCDFFHQDPGKLLPRIMVPSLLLIPAGLFAGFVLN